MPAQRPRAFFEPIPPDLNVTELVESTPNFEFAHRIHCDTIDQKGEEVFEDLVLFNVILRGIPLVIEGFNERLDSSVFSKNWLKKNYSAKTEIARNLTNKSNLPLTIGHYLKNLPLLTNQWTSYNYRDPDRQRIYLKDIDCPPPWHELLKDLIPASLFYLNESVLSLSENRYDADLSAEAPIARAGDLMSCLPPNMRADNMMCYIGHEGTYTPAHQEMCASLGQNIMVEASDGSIEDGKPTKPGSSIWIMTESKDRDVVSEFWISILGHDIDIEDHFAQINALKKAPFKIYIVEQRPGDLILVPPVAAHQVWNRGTRTMKVAWNRTTVVTLKLALSEALPHARMVCRDEQYKNKAIVFYTLDRYSNLLSRVDDTNRDYLRVQELQADFQRLFAVYTQILLSESFSQSLPGETDAEFISFDSNITCSYCRCNIFNRFLSCPFCVGTLSADGEDTYDICMECYVMGRSCGCISRLKWVEQFHWSELTEKHESWRQLIVRSHPDLNNQYQPFLVDRGNMGKKTLAEICQEQLVRRPWVDITKPVGPRFDENENSGGSDNATPSTKRRKILAADMTENEARCHICKYPEPWWKLATCFKCKSSYCYGSLYRAFNIKPQQTMEMHKWKCPKCEKICSCFGCRKDPEFTPYEPTGLLLGHDTRKIADPRSVESLVDFRHSNLQWLKKTGEDDETRLRKRQQEAENKRNQSEETESSIPSIRSEEPPQMKEEHSSDHSTVPSVDYGDIPVDPALEQFDCSFPTTPDSTSP